MKTIAEENLDAARLAFWSAKRFNHAARAAYVDALMEMEWHLEAEVIQKLGNRHRLQARAKTRAVLRQFEVDLSVAVTCEAFADPFIYAYRLYLLHPKVRSTRHELARCFERLGNTFAAQLVEPPIVMDLIAMYEIFQGERLYNYTQLDEFHPRPNEIHKYWVEKLWSPFWAPRQRQMAVVWSTIPENEQ